MDASRVPARFIFPAAVRSARELAIKRADHFFFEDSSSHTEILTDRSVAARREAAKAAEAFLARPASLTYLARR